MRICLPGACGDRAIPAQHLAAAALPLRLVPCVEDCRLGGATAHCPGLLGLALEGSLAALRPRDEQLSRSGPNGSLRRGPQGVPKSCPLHSALVLSSTPDSCAVVGSSGGLRGAHFGPYIDAHEAVTQSNATPGPNPHAYPHPHPHAPRR